MNYFEKYKAVNTPYGTTLPSHVNNYSKKSARRTFLQSPTLSQIQINESEEEVNSVVSVYGKDFFDRTFLFEPDSEHAKLGNYAHHRGYTYLFLKSNDNDIYPNMYAKLCNEDFKVPIETRKILVPTTRGTTYKTEYVYKNVPIVIDVKGYSIADNAVLPLTEGRVIIYMQYQPIYVEKITLNYEFEIFNDKYKISDIQLDKVINGEGYIVLSAQKVSEVNVD